MTKIVNRFEKTIKRNIRESKRFRMGSKIDVYALQSCSFDLFLKTFEKVNNKNKLHIELNKIYIKNPLEFINITKKYSDILVFFPNEMILLFFILNMTNIVKNDLYLKKSKNYINLGYGLSEYYVCKGYNRDYIFFLKENKFESIERLIIDIVSRDEKYIKSPLKSIEYLSKFVQKWQESS